MPGRPQSRGFSLIDLLTVLLALILLAALALPALSQARDEAKIAACANNLKQLAEADLKYASEFNGKFFYDWGRGVNPEGEAETNWQARWWDKERVGKYVKGVELQWLRSPGQLVGGKIEPAEAMPFVNDAGLGGGAFVCPADEGAMRSYHQNFWASGVDVPQPSELTESAREYWRHFSGQFFDSNDQVPHDRLILFGEMLAVFFARHQDPPTVFRRVTSGEFGSQSSPRIRFAGATGGSFWPHGTVGISYPTQIDYARHSNQHITSSGMIRPTAIGGINIAYADGHVAWREHTDLYDSETTIPTYKTLWSPVDQKVE